jgi:hypothetical protein
MPRGIIALIMAVSLLQGCGKGGSLKEMLPDEIAGWQAIEPAVFYDGEQGIFEYMNGGAEVYLAYDFNGLTARKYSRNGLPEIQVEIYDMGSPPDAFGIFSFERSAPTAGVGQGSEYDRGMLRFWQGRYFFNIYASQEDAALEAALKQLAGGLVTLVGATGQAPSLVQALPQIGLQSDSIKYFHGAFGLKYHYFLVQEDVLVLGKKTEVIIATYSQGKSTMKVLLARYANPEAAALGVQGYQSIRAELVKDKGYTAVKQSGSLLAIVFEAPNQETAESTLSEVNR